MAALVAGSLSACKKGMDLTPNYQVTASSVYSTPAGYKQALAKVYGSMALTGNTGPSGSPDLPIGDEGQNVDFFRTWWGAQELSTDEAVSNWGDAGLADFHNLNWNSSNNFLKGLYYRSMYQITLCNDFIRQSSDANLSSRGITGSDATDVHYYVAEARFIRAFQYWVLMDLFGNPPFVTDANAVGSALPPQTDRKTLFNYIESELKAIDGSLKAPRTNEYGRADQAAEWALLARLYLNAQVYTGTARYADAITYANKVINAGYTLMPVYDNLMLADNNVANTEFIWTINYDGLKTTSYGGTTFMTHAQVGGSMPAAAFGLNGGWGGMRTTRALSDLFPANTSTAFPNNGNPDTRAEFWTDGQTADISDVTNFTGGGYGVNKYRNVLSTNAAQSGSSKDYSDVDFPVFRLAEMYLIYAEAVLRGGTGGDAATALTYINKLRTRAYAGKTTGNIAASDLTTDFILQERARELYWECQRRTDLVRYGRFAESTYLWQWKGGVKTGTGVPSFRNLFPIPVDDINANSNLKQNPGY
ncbi:putative outer membrane starch-binding protein [Mucilaginibacter yixingensis]|uniref:Putative outer membrane starch-binding protein n=2 Tax=Mucilaginibacter yixingensis TaxID=1295612 RepID=A0A2T5JGE2_9SPHI|nr:putative outer membrane starch-binding protein [Mucilaginibacter yixingensis]